MMQKLWLRISFAFISLIFLVLLGIGAYAANMMKDTYIEMMRNQLSQDAKLALETIDTARLMERPQALQREVERFAEAVQTRITIIDWKGNVLADSEEDPAAMENHGDRPEFREAVRNGRAIGEAIRFSTTLGYEMMYVALPIVRDERVIGVMRVAVTLEQVQKAVRQLWVSLASVMGGVLILSALISIKMAQGITRPIEEIIRVARHLTQKKYDSRVRVQTKDELEQLASAINFLASSLQQQMEEIQENEQRLAGVLTNLVSGVMLIGSHRRIVLVNPAMEQILGSPADYLVGKLHIEASKNFGLSQLIDKCLKQGGKIREEVHVYYPKERILDAHLAPYLNEEGEIRGVITVLHDITEIRRLEKMRSEFVANVSHELKTPITAVKGFAETLLDGAMHDEETCRSFLKIIYDESDRLHRLINDILNLSKIEQQRLPLKIETVNLSDLVYETTATLQEQISKKKLTLHLPEQRQVFIEGEKDRLRQIILNLVANGIAYTPEGGKISVQLVEKAEEVDLVVADTGIGIPQKDLHRIFERFYRVDKARSRESGGTGLGLAIVKHLVESHHGRIHVESEEGRGSTFTITLPKKQNPA
ncbi:ATP-binding protein [Bacillaceae bacterium]